VSRSIDRPIINLVASNHNSTHGIGEILFAIYHVFSGAFDVRRSTDLKADCINVIIDEFSRAYFVQEVKSIKAKHPDTRIIVIATEFITPVRVLGIEITKTFNFFGGYVDWKNLGKNAAREAIGKVPLYMQRRYRGFIECLGVTDLLVYLHPGMEQGFADLGAGSKSLRAPPMVVYPEINLQAVGKGRLRNLPFGFTQTGTLTRFRARIARQLVKTLRFSGYDQSAYVHVSFDQTPPVVFDEGQLMFNYDEPATYLFNLNPPQHKTWPYSSPMRIMRAALLGQIPVVTKKFGDHELEQIALLWDGKIETAIEFQRLGFSGRDELIAKYAASVAAYNEMAKGKNAPLLEAIRRLG
jgi:hypothetical protein